MNKARQLRLTMLGTGNAMATECYNTCFAIDDGEYCFLVDAGGGNGIIRQLRQAGIRYDRISDIFITHRHADHITGMIWIFRLLSRPRSADVESLQVNIYGHDEVIDVLNMFVDKLYSEREQRQIRQSVRLVTVKDADTAMVLDHEVTFFDIRSTKAKQFGFTMRLADGKLTCCGDEPYQPHELRYAEDSKWLFHEAFCLDAQKDEYRPHEKHHSTVKDACEIAQTIGVQNLVLYHTEDGDLSHRSARYQKEGSEYFKGQLFVPDDLFQSKL